MTSKTFETPAGDVTMEVASGVTAIDWRAKTVQAAMLRALLDAEWGGNDGEAAACPGCIQVRAVGHVGCFLDEALTAAGYPSAGSRDRARRDLQRVIDSCRLPWRA